MSLPSSKTSSLRPQHEGQLHSHLHRTKTCNSELSHWRAFVAVSQQGLLPLNQGTSLVEPPLSSELSIERCEWLVLGVASPLAPDDTLRYTLFGMIWTTSTTTFHNLWYGGFVNLPHGLLRNPFLRDHFDTSHNLLLDLRDCHVHKSFNGALLITLLWDQSHNFTDLLHDLRNVHLRLAVWTQHRRSTFLRTSANSFPDSLTYCTSTRGTCTTAFAIKTSTSCSKLHPKHLFRNCLHLLGRSSTVLSSVHHFGTHVMLPRVARG